MQKTNMSSSIKNLNHVLAYQLEGVYEIIKTLQGDLSRAWKMIDDPEMRMVFNAYHHNLGDQRLKLKRIFGYLLNGPYGRKASHDANAIVQWAELSEKNILPRLRDVILGSSLGLAIQYQITTYTEARYIAMRLELDVVVSLLDEMIDSDEEFSRNLKRLTSIQVNQACLLTTN